MRAKICFLLIIVFGITSIWLIFVLFYNYGDALVAHSTATTTNKKGVLIAYGGDSAAGFATNYFTYVINFILFAHSLKMDLSIQYTAEYNDKYYDAKIGNNSFNYFFEAIQPSQPFNASNWRPIPYDNLSFIHHNMRQSVLECNFWRQIA